MKIKSLLTALTSWVIISLPIVEASDSLPLTGRALYSFSTEYALIATESHIYKILKSNISEEDLAQVNHSSIQNNTISINVPKSSIEFYGLISRSFVKKLQKNLMQAALPFS